MKIVNKYQLKVIKATNDYYKDNNQIKLHPSEIAKRYKINWTWCYDNKEKKIKAAFY